MSPLRSQRLLTLRGDAHVPTPSAREHEPLGEPYRAYRTVLTWYCWRAAELRAGAAASAVTT